MEEKRAITKTEFIQRGYDAADYHFIEEAGTFQARLDLKVWGKRWLECFFTLSDERKILACAFPEVNYLGIAEIPIGSELTLTFEKTARSKRIYLRKATMGKVCP